MVRCSSPMGHTPRPRSTWAVSGYWKPPIWTRHSRGRARVPSPAMRRARCASFFSTRLRNKDPAKASKQPGDCRLGTRAVVARSRSRRNAMLPIRQSAMRRRTMKYICLGYLEPGKFENMSESERNTVFDECFSYNDELRKNGHLVAEEPLQPANTAVTVYWKNGKVAVTDGPYAETKEQLGGIQVLQARDLNHAIQLISQSPGLRLGCGLIEIRPAADISEMMKASEQRRRQKPAR